MQEDYILNISDIHKLSSSILWVIHNVCTLRGGGRVESALGGGGYHRQSVRFIFENFGKIAHSKEKSQGPKNEINY